MAKTTDQLLREDWKTINAMNTQQLKQAVSILSSTANKRLKRLGSSEIGRESPAYQYAQKRTYQGVKGGKFGVSRKTSRKDLLNEYKAVQQFLNQKTSSVSGIQQEVRKIEKRLGTKFKNYKEQKEFWKAYRQLEQEHKTSPDRHEKYFGSKETQIELRNLQKNPKYAQDTLRRINEHNVSKNRRNREDYIDDLTSQGVIMLPNHHKQKVEIDSWEDLYQIMNMGLEAKYEEQQEEENRRFAENSSIPYFEEDETEEDE